MKAASTVREGAVGKGLAQAEHLAGRLTHFSPHDRDLARLEAETRAARRRLWARPDPVPPWAWRKGDPAQPEVIGNRSSRVYHRPHCASVARMKESNRVPFATAGEAEAQGYRKAGDRP